MLFMSQSLINRPVLSLRLGGPIAVAIEPIINPHNLKILGWWCNLPDSRVPLVLLIEDVREILPDGLAVNDESALSAIDELVRHKDVLEIRFKLLDKPVKTKHQKLGKVSDYAYDSDSLAIEKIYVSRPLAKVFSGGDDTLIIGRKQIVEVNDHFILVRDADVKASDSDLAEAPAAAA